jgi:hypothetical protein
MNWFSKIFRNAHNQSSGANVDAISEIFRDPDKSVQFFTAAEKAREKSWLELVAGVRFEMLEKTYRDFVPRQVIENCRRCFFNQLDDIADRVVEQRRELEPGWSHERRLRGEPENFSYADTRSGIYMVVSIMCCTTQQAVQTLAELSNEKPLGYVHMMKNLFINNWPSPKLLHFLHVLLCLGDPSSKQIHTVIGDRGALPPPGPWHPGWLKMMQHTVRGNYGMSPTAPKKFITWPRDLLNEEERQMLGHPTVW